MNLPLLEISGLFFSYPGQPPILRGINLTLGAGENIAVTGANGAGKSTLFRCITGLEKATHGNILFDGKPVLKEKDFVNLRRHAGYALQNPEDQLFFPDLMEDLCFGPLNMGFSMREAQHMAKDALALLGMESFEHRLTSRLSGGEQKLAALAAVLAMRPRILLLDEPFNGLDDKNATKLENVLQRLQCAKIIITHNIEFIRPLNPTPYQLADGCLRTL